MESNSPITILCEGVEKTKPALQRIVQNCTEKQKQSATNNPEFVQLGKEKTKPVATKQSSSNSSSK